MRKTFIILRNTRLIKRATGQTFSQLLTNKRIENSKQLLIDTSLSILEIAQQVGYESSDHFIRTFKNKCGITPNEYRHRHQT
ncbi:MAG: helix-turn-helix transcriptional regulator [Clostridiales bacterium]|nr:helix-turn-helix transcriptional regulator [Clostridiales bacterium]